MGSIIHSEIPLPYLFLAWYLASVFCTTTSKVLIQDVFGSAFWLSLCQFGLAAVMGNFIIRWMLHSNLYQVPRGSEGRALRASLWQLSFIFSFGMLALNKGYEHMHVSLVETLRATEPVVSTLLASILLPSDVPGAKQCLCLLPIVLGACCSSVGSAEFTLLGFAWVSASNVCFCWRTIQYKQVRKSFCIDDWNLFYHICRRGFVCQLIYALLGDFSSMRAAMARIPMIILGATAESAGRPFGIVRLRDIGMVIFNGAMYYTYLQLSWVILMRVSVVSHAVGNSMRRPVVLLCSVMYFRNEISLLNAAGICLALGGVFLYTQARR
eukprot:TRINITY_DN71398_c0_g1_i1.p1 TRINITY_DN71398_c0_g1~~TRINITY_DN71398_c0_g1_i1.p1  ORF type:complete len:325 (-),score=25.64 TRINITY_DN71398_c0_g1_i1:243-1217(-)